MNRISSRRWRGAAPRRHAVAVAATPNHAGGPDAAAQRARQAELEREVADLRSKVANLTETLDKVVGVLASQGLGLDGEHLPPLKKPRYDRQDSEQLFLERLPSSVRGVAPLDFAPHSLDGLATSPRLADARGLEGQPLRRFGAEAVPGPAPAESTPAQQKKVEPVIPNLSLYK